MAFTLETIVVVVGVHSVLESLFYYFTRGFTNTAPQELVTSVTAKWTVVGMLFVCGILMKGN